jgi:myo-inositol-1(or 4)-monophosphatase
MQVTPQYDMEILKRVARQAGEFMRNAHDMRQSSDKTNTKDFVTIADIKSQDIIRHALAEQYPDASILSEEDDENVRKPMYEPDFTGFILDPIDGTYNFKRNMQESAISIGYIEDGEPVAGVVYDPYKDELYEAEAGKGAFCNGEPIRVSGQQSIEGASIATSNSYDDEAMARNLYRHLAIYDQTGHMPWTNCPGSGVLIMTNIACGRYDAYHHNGLKPWDNAAAFLIVREAGGVVQTLTGEDAAFITSSVLIGNPTVVSRLREVFNEMEPKLLT